MERIRSLWVDGVGGENGKDENERVDPGMAEGEGFPAPEVRASFPSFGMQAGNFALGITLDRDRQFRALECLYENLTGDRAGETGKVGVGSSVDNAEAPVSPLNSAPRLLDFRRGRGIVSLSSTLDLEFLPGNEGCWIVAPAKECECDDMATSR